MSIVRTGTIQSKSRLTLIEPQNVTHQHSATYRKTVQTILSFTEGYNANTKFEHYEFMFVIELAWAIISCARST